MFYLMNRETGLIVTESDSLDTIQQWEDDLAYSLPETNGKLGVFSLETEGWVEYV